MVMNHYKRPKRFYVRTKVWYTTEPRTPIVPLVIGDCAQLANGMAYDVPGGGSRGSNFVDQSEWIAPFSGRLMVAASHQHGGGKYQTLESRTCGRRIFKAPVYHGPPTTPTTRSARSCTSPARSATGAFASGGVPVVAG